MDAHSIACALGGDARGNRVSAPGPGHSPRDRSLSILVDPQAPEGFVVSSFAGDDPLECRDHVRAALGLPGWQPRSRCSKRTPRPMPMRTPKIGDDTDGTDSKKIVAARSIWQRARPINGTHAEAYLLARGIACPDNPSLRFVAATQCGGKPYPAMVAAVLSPTREVCAVQLTFLDPRQPRKADVAVSRKTIGVMGSGAVRLGKAGDMLGIAEGVETGLAAIKLADVPIWCCLGAARMHQVEFPDTVRELHVFADDDVPGRNAADRTVARHKSRRVILRLPPAGLKDWNDVLRAGYSV